MVSVVFNLLKELLLSIVGKLAFKAIFERFATRLLIYALEKLRKESDNEVVDKTVDDIIDSLRGKRLKVIEDLTKGE